VQVKRISAFTNNGLGGNPAGVLLTQEPISTEKMQAIAAEVGYSETVFASPNPDGSWRVRYFAPETEVPFCGHATIALGAVLGDTQGPGRYALSLSKAEIEVSAEEIDGTWVSTLLSPPTRSSPADPDLVDEALLLFGYTVDELDPLLPPRRANAGTEHLVLPLNSRDALKRMDYDLDEGRRFMEKHGIGTVAFIFREEERRFQARNAFAIGGVLEDPATGAAAAAFAGMLRDLQILSDGTFVIHQGENMGQPSRIEVTLTETPGAPVSVRGRSSVIV